MIKTKESDLQDKLRFFVRTSIIAFISVALGKLLSYAYRFIIGRYFGPEIYGLFTLSTVIIGWFVVFSIFGLTAGILRYSALYRGKKDFNKIRFIVRFSLILLTGISLIAGVLLFFVSDYISINWFNNADLAIFLKIMSLAIPLTTLLNVSFSILLGFQKVATHSLLFNLVQNGVKVLFLVLFIFLGIKSNSVPISYLFGVGITAVAAYYLINRITPKIFQEFSLGKNERKKVLGEILSYSWPFLFYGIIGSLLYSVDSFFIGLFRTAEEVGFYNAAVPIALILGLAAELCMQIFLPVVILEYSKKNISLIKEISKQVGKWTLAVNLPVFVFIVIFPSEVITFLFGQEFVAASTALRFLAFGSLISSLFMISNNLLAMVGRSKLILIDTVISVVLNVILDLLFVPRYGINGAAVSTVISLLVLNGLFLFQAKHYLEIVPLRKKMAILIVVAAAFGFLLKIISYKIEDFSGILLVLIAILYYLIYVIFVFILGGLDRHDIMVVKGLKNKIVGKI